MRCPVAYHTSCLPKSCAQNFPGKRIICPKHEGSQIAAPGAISATEASSSSRSEADATVKDMKLIKESKPLKHHGSEREDSGKVRSSSDRHTTDDDRAGGGDGDIKNEGSGGASSSSKKLSKSAKREKKKKKKKRKKQKKHESRSRGGHEDEDDGEEDASTGRVKVDSDDDDDDDENESASHAEGGMKRESPYDLPALNVTFPDAVSPATSSSLFESPATTNERIKARLVEALGHSDDDVESLASSPIAFSNLKLAKVDSDEAKDDEIDGLCGSPEPVPVSQDRVNVKQETVCPLPVSTSVQPDVKELVLTSTSQAPVAEYESSHSAGGYASNSQSSGEKPSLKGDRKVRKDRVASVDGREMSRQLSEAASDRKSSKKQKHGYDGLSLQIPGSPGLNRPGGADTRGAARKDGSVSEGEEGDDEGPGGSSTPTLRRRASTGGSGTPRGMTTTDDLKGKATSAARISKKKKKKKTKSSTEHSAADVARGEQNDGLTGEDATNQEEKDEAKWVQCDSCKKWRTVPKNIDLNSMPERWYCKMNTWDSAYASCAVAEEIANATSKKPKSGSHGKKSKMKSRAKPQPDVQEAATAASTGGVSDGGASSPSSGSGSHTSKKASPEPEGSTAIAGASESMSKLTKKQEKQAKKRKLKLKLKEKYREVKWVQCESAQCGKWRVVPSSIDFNLLPTVWYCHLNTWAPEMAKCSASNPPEVEAYLMKSHSKKGNSSSSSGSRPNKKIKPSSEAPVSTPTTTGQSGAGSGVGTVTGGQCDAPAKPAKPAKAPKSATPSTPATFHSNVNNGGQDAGPVSFSSTVPSSATAASTQPDAGGGLATGSSTQPISHNPLGTSNNAIGGGKGRKVKPDGIKKTVLEWAQCEKCNKWRKLPQHIKSSTLPDKWYCSMNHWDPVRASCTIPEEVDQEPVGASPLPSSQNWYPMPGQVSGNGSGTGASGIRSKRSKLSYTELLYASTGQLRKTYTSESSTLSFEHGGRTYQRDDQYKDSSMYVSPDAIANAHNLGRRTADDSTGVSGSRDTSKQAASSSTDATDELASDRLHFDGLTTPNQPSVEQIAALVLDSMDVRRSSTIVELFRAANANGGAKDSMSQEQYSDLSLSLVAAAVSHLVQRGLIERQDGELYEATEEQIEENDGNETADIRVGSKRRKSSEALFASSSRTFQYRKVPKRPLKASKCWRLGQSAFEFPLKE